eukprot:TRINITY_DN15431_c0_g1_i1.p1 TRINITY_DN15431_c0_g1~~TRINITY_DN15431_c0_g1_i1.p1  ORF type:complete len:648 (-),score=157.71 TRINITY_DN15431_c0_g1_i1:49-1992(-)
MGDMAEELQTSQAEGENEADVAPGGGTAVDFAPPPRITPAASDVDAAEGAGGEEESAPAEAVEALAAEDASPAPDAAAVADVDGLSLAEKELAATAAVDTENGTSDAADDAAATDTTSVAADATPAAEDAPSAVAGDVAGATASSADASASASEASPSDSAAADAAAADAAAAEAAAAGAGAPVDERRRIWRPRRSKCPEETDSDSSWYKHRRHVLILTQSGKPVYTRYGCEDGIVSTTGALAAIVAKMQKFFFTQAVDDDSLRCMITGSRIFVFVERGPLWLVCVASTGDSYVDLVRMLDRVHVQIITILTASIERTLVARPNYDVRGLLGGTDCVVNSMIRWCGHDLQVDGFEPLPLPPASRATAVDALRAVKVKNLLCAFLLAGHRILAIVTNKQFSVQAKDLHAVVNLIMSSASLRSGESWTPLCLVSLNQMAFAYAYISYIEGTDVGVVCLSTAADGDQFYAISQQAALLKKSLLKSGCLEAVEGALARCPIDFREESAAGAASASESAAASGPRRSKRRALLAPWPPAQYKRLELIIHAAYFVPPLQQFFSSAVAAPYNTCRRTKLLFRRYGRCRAMLRRMKQPCQVCMATDHECFYVFLAPEFQLYLAVPRGTSTGVIGQLYQWFRAQEAHVFLGSIPTW